MTINSAEANLGSGGVKFRGQFDSDVTFHPSGAGSVGSDFSAGQPQLANVEENFPGSGPYASYVWLLSVPKNNSRAQLRIFPSTAVLVVIDDGTAASGEPPVNASIYPLMAYQSDQNNCELGRYQIYGPPGSTLENTQVMIREN